MEQLLGGLGLAPPGVEVDQLGEGLGIAGLDARGRDGRTGWPGRVASAHRYRSCSGGGRWRPSPGRASRPAGAARPRRSRAPDPPGRGPRYTGGWPRAGGDPRRSPGRSGTEGRGGSSPGWLKKAATSGRQPDGRAAGPVEDLGLLGGLGRLGLGLVGPGLRPRFVTRSGRRPEQSEARDRSQGCQGQSRPTHRRAHSVPPFSHRSSEPVAVAAATITNSDRSTSRWRGRHRCWPRRVDAPSSLFRPDLSRSYGIVTRHGNGLPRPSAWADFGAWRPVFGRRIGRSPGREPRGKCQVAPPGRRS